VLQRERLAEVVIGTKGVLDTDEVGEGMMMVYPAPVRV
jgi:hypothetical protein